MISVLAMIALLGAATLGAAWRGARVEYTGVVIFSVGWMTTLVVKALTPGVEAGWPLLAIHLALLLGLVILAWKSPRPWPAWSAGFEALAVALGVAFLAHPGVGLETYLKALDYALYGAVGAMALGVWGRDNTAQS